MVPDVDTQATMFPGAVETEEGAEGEGDPLGIRVATIKASLEDDKKRKRRKKEPKRR